MRLAAKALIAFALCAPSSAALAAEAGLPALRSDFNLAVQKAHADYENREMALLFVSGDCEGCESLSAHLQNRDPSRRAAGRVEIQALDALGGRKRVHLAGDRLVSEADLAREFGADPGKPTLVILRRGIHGNGEARRLVGFSEIAAFLAKGQ